MVDEIAPATKISTKNNYLTLKEIKRMRLFIFVLLAAMLSCGRASVPVTEKALTEQSLVGQWNIVNKMSPAEVERITKVNGARNIGGYLIFKADKTYEFLFNVTTRDDIFDARTTGTYKYENDVLSFTDNKSNKAKRSTLKFEDNLLVVTPLEDDVDANFLIYLKHVE